MTLYLEASTTEILMKEYESEPDYATIILSLIDIYYDIYIQSSENIDIIQNLVEIETRLSTLYTVHPNVFYYPNDDFFSTDL